MTEEDLRKIQLHFRKYRDAYVVLAGGIAIGYILRGKPKVNEKAVVENWLQHLAENGVNLYGLTNEQKALWESCWAYIHVAAKESKLAPSEAIVRLIADYKDFVDTSPLKVVPTAV